MAEIRDVAAKRLNKLTSKYPNLKKQVQDSQDAKTTKAREEVEGSPLGNLRRGSKDKDF